MIKLNRRITVIVWGTTQNAIGSPVAAIAAAWDMWAQVEDRSGSNFAPYQQSVWQYDYKITVRCEETRVIGSNYTIDYNNKRLKINSVSFVEEAYQMYTVLRCTALDPSVATGAQGSVPPLPQIGVYNYTAASVLNTWVASELINKTIFGAFKDGVLFNIITTGIPVQKQVLFTKATGTLLWSVDFEIGESAVIQYIP